MELFQVQPLWVRVELRITRCSLMLYPGHTFLKVSCPSAGDTASETQTSPADVGSVVSYEINTLVFEINYPM